jgi:hypothetical protein
LGVLELQQASEWDLPSFIVPKKNNTVRFHSNFWEVNKRLVRKPFPIPKISTVLKSYKDSLLQKPLILTWAITPLPLDWIQMHPKSAPSSSLGGKNPTSDYRLALQVLQTYSNQKCQG